MCVFFFLHGGYVCPGSEAAPRRRTRERGGERAINSFEVHGLVVSRLPLTVIRPHSHQKHRCSRLHPSCRSRCRRRPAEGNEVGSGGREDAGQTKSWFSLPVTVSTSSASPPCGRKRGRARRGGRTRDKQGGCCGRRRQQSRRCPRGPARNATIMCERVRRRAPGTRSDDVPTAPHLRAVVGRARPGAQFETAHAGLEGYRKTPGPPRTRFATTLAL